MNRLSNQSGDGSRERKPSKSRKSADAMPRFKLPEPEGTIPKPAEKRAEDMDLVQLVKSFEGTRFEPYIARLLREVAKHRRQFGDDAKVANILGSDGLVGMVFYDNTGSEISRLVRTPDGPPEGKMAVPSEIQRRVNRLLASPYRKAFQMTVDVMFNEWQEGHQPRAACPVDDELQRMLKTAMAGPKKNFLLDAIEMAYGAAIVSGSWRGKTG